ncbi:YceI family protein [Rhizobium leguminosarum]|uniref:YceI family protein n=1 Tax=Rhizobium leguminosarum TaxID=384 RepID=UPI001FED8DC8|nr:YceI family protein [Rhizobium leguminosarum]
MNTSIIGPCKFTRKAMFMRCLYLLTLWALFATSAFPQSKPSPAPSGAYVSDPAHSSVTWKVGHFGLSNYTARFTKMNAELIWDAENPAASRVSASIDPTSVRTDFPFPEVEDFDKKIGHDGNFFAAQPISFSSTEVKLTAENRGQVTGDLTFRGQTRPVTIDVTFNGSMAEHPMDKAPKLGFSAIAKIKRSEWGLSLYVPAVSDEVTIVIETELAPRKATN